MAKLNAYLTLFRLSNLPTIFTNVLVGTVLSEGILFSWVFWKIVFSCSLFYIAGMIFNDLFDYRWDKKYRPDRPLAANLISIDTALFWGILFIIIALLSLITINNSTFWAGICLICFIMVYDAWHKKNALSPLVMGCCRATVYLIAFLAFSSLSDLSQSMIASSLLLAAYLMGLTYLAKGKFKWILLKWIAILLLFFPISYVVYQQDMLNYYVLFLIFIDFLWLVYTLNLYFKEKTNSGIAKLIAGISLIDTLIISLHKIEVNILLTGLTGWVLTLFFQKYIQGT